MNWLVFHIACGQAFFSGVLLLVIAAFTSTRSQPLYRRLTSLAFLTGLILVVISSTAIPYWLYAIAIVFTLTWLASAYVKPWRPWSAYAFAAAWLAAAVFELPYHATPKLQPAQARTMAVIGDSVTAGIGRNDKAVTWPRLISRQHDLIVQDISHVGETAGSALKRAQTQPISAAVVIVEIGGNDLLGSTSPKRFARDLDALLKFIVAPNRQVVMFELPLPPFQHEYGRAQRRLAAKHNVLLVPKRVFLSVIAEDAATLDKIHLSPHGHQRMAKIVWRLVQPAFDP